MFCCMRKQKTHRHFLQVILNWFIHNPRFTAQGLQSYSKTSTIHFNTNCSTFSKSDILHDGCNAAFAWPILYLISVIHHPSDEASVNGQHSVLKLNSQHVALITLVGT